MTVERLPSSGLPRPPRYYAPLRLLACPTQTAVALRPSPCGPHPPQTSSPAFPSPKLPSPAVPTTPESPSASLRGYLPPPRAAAFPT